MGPAGGLGPKPADKSELEWQLRNFTKFYWVCGSLWSEMDIHQVDELCWLHDALPVSAQGVCGRIANSTDCSQNLDSFNVEWTFPNGTRAMHTVRYIAKTESHFATYVHGSKKAAQFSGNTHAADVEIYKDQNVGRRNIEWRAPKEKRTSGMMSSKPSARTNPSIRRSAPHTQTSSRSWAAPPCTWAAP
jgi:predicted dehydrogenase